MFCSPFDNLYLSIFLCQRNSPLHTARRDLMAVKKCKVKGCDSELLACGYCSKHYQEVRKYGRVRSKRKPQKCAVRWCEEEVAAKRYCMRHYQQLRRHGRLTPERERLIGQVGCRYPGCKERYSAQGYCKPHYMKLHFLRLPSQTKRRSLVHHIQPRRKRHVETSR